MDIMKLICEMVDEIKESGKNKSKHNLEVTCIMQ